MHLFALAKSNNVFSAIKDSSSQGGGPELLLHAGGGDAALCSQAHLPLELGQGVSCPQRVPRVLHTPPRLGDRFQIGVLKIQFILMFSSFMLA